VIFIGGSHSLHDRSVFQRLSLVAFFAWVGLGADGLSSSCYGPPESFLALGSWPHLAIFVALGSALTVLIISASYSQIIDLFPTGGGGYLVSTRLLSPAMGMVSGCALLIDYVLTITLSVASGADAIFSFLPESFYPYRLVLAVAGVALLTLLNLRGVKESVLPLVPIFLIFLLTHVVAILVAFVSHSGELPAVLGTAGDELRHAAGTLGWTGALFLILRAYSMGAGTYTGIEAVSNGLPILREPKARTGKTTMHYMAFSLSFMVLGLIFAYLLYGVRAQPGKTLNAVLFERVAGSWGEGTGYAFILTALISEAAILFVAAQTGFLDGPRVLSSMALDRWVPTRFAMLSDRLVTQNGILLMGGAAVVLMVATGGSVTFLVVLYSINVFITFVLSQLGMVRHWLSSDLPRRFRARKLAINGLGLVLCVSILIVMTVLKFNEGGWITILVTGTLIGAVILIKRHYTHTARLLGSLNALVAAAETAPETAAAPPPSSADPAGRTAVLLVNGFNGLGLHTLFSVFRMFGGIYKNYIFIQIGAVDVGTFKSPAEIERLTARVKGDLDRYVAFMGKNGYYAEGIFSLGTDVVAEISRLAPELVRRFPHSAIFAGRLVFPDDSFVSRWLHNFTVGAVQKNLYRMGIPFFVLPIPVWPKPDRPVLPCPPSSSLMS
jgi:amino acid transporter